MRGLFVLLILTLPLDAQTGNKPERLEWFRDLGFGLFIHWSADSQLGSVISHSMVGADEQYLRRYIDLLPRTFNPRKFVPKEWAVLAKLAGVKYAVFTAKHHNGFCMFHSRTTAFGVASTPFRRDITAELMAAFREEGIAPGLYFSPDDFWWLHNNGKTLQRNTPDVAPVNNPGLLKHDQAQVRELLTQYGPIGVMFFDGPPEGLKDLAWRLQPDIVVTRGAMETPEQYVPGMPLDGAWESCITMGTQWQYKPTNENYKPGTELISLLVETRAKGGNLLLNIGPKPDGEIAIEQEERLREIALWMFINSESIYGVRPWVITNEGETWFTRKKDENTVYAIVKTRERWKYGEWRDIVLKSVKAAPRTVISVLGQSGRVLEYSAAVPETTWEQKPDGLHIRAMRAQRIYNDRKWPNPVVLKITNAEPGLRPPVVETLSARWDAAAGLVVFEGEWKDTGQPGGAEVGFEYRSVKGLDLTERPEGYRPAGLIKLARPGVFRMPMKAAAGDVLEWRAVVKHPLITTYGREKRVNLR